MVRVLPKSKLKPLFIGFGKQACKYADVFKKYNINIEGACVKNIKKNKTKFKKYNVKNKFSSINLALKSKSYNCIFVFLPWNMIEKKIEQVLKFSKHKVFCEKPLALSYSKLRKIKKISNKYNKGLYVLYNRRFYETFNFLEKKLKEIKRVEIIIPERKKSLVKILGRGIIGKIKYHYTAHWIDFFRFLLKVPISEVTKEKNSFNFKFKKNNKIKISLKLFYSENEKIRAIFYTKTRIYKLKSLEKLYEFDNKKKYFSIKIDETKINTFKPGILSLVDTILKNKLAKLKKIDDIVDDFKFLKTLPY